MSTMEYKELIQNVTEARKVMGEMRNDFENVKSYKKTIEDLSNEYKTMKDAIAALQEKSAMAPTAGIADEIDHKAFDAFARKGVAFNNTTVGEQGGYLVPRPLYNKIMELALEDNVIRQGAEILSTTAGSLQLPVEVNSDSVEMFGELETVGSEVVKFENVDIQIHKFARDVPVTDELIADSAFNVEQFVTGHIARRLAAAEENTFINGQSPKNPEGILKASGLDNVTAASATAVTLDELVDMRTKSGVAKTSVLNKAVYVMNPATFQALTKLKDSQNRPFYLPIGDKVIPAIQGFECKLSTAMPTMATGKKAFVFGDLSAYKIVDRQDMTIKRNDMRVRGQVIFEFTKRCGAAVGDKSKLVTLTMA